MAFYQFDNLLMLPVGIGMLAV